MPSTPTGRHAVKKSDADSIGLNLRELSAVAPPSPKADGGGKLSPRGGRGSAGFVQRPVLILFNAIALIAFAHAMLGWRWMRVPVSSSAVFPSTMSPGDWFSPEPTPLVISRARRHGMPAHAVPADRRLVRHGGVCNATSEAALRVDTLAATRALNWAAQVWTPSGTIERWGKDALERAQAHRAEEVSSTLCSDLGPACIQDGEIHVFRDDLQPVRGIYRRVSPEIVQRLNLIYTSVRWGAQPPQGDRAAATSASTAGAGVVVADGPEESFEAFRGASLHFGSETGTLRMWPAGSLNASRTSLPFPKCDDAAAPLLLYWSAHEDAWRTLASFSRVWSAVGLGYINPRMSVALALGHAHAPPPYVMLPLASVFSGGVTTLDHFAVQHGRRPASSIDADGSSSADSYVVDSMNGSASVSLAVQQQRRQQQRWRRRWERTIPSTVCYNHVTVCAVGARIDVPAYAVKGLPLDAAAADSTPSSSSASASSVSGSGRKLLLQGSQGAESAAVNGAAAPPVPLGAASGTAPDTDSAIARGPIPAWPQEIPSSFSNDASSSGAGGVDVAMAIAFARADALLLQRTPDSSVGTLPRTSDASSMRPPSYDASTPSAVWSRNGTLVGSAAEVPRGMWGFMQHLSAWLRRVPLSHGTASAESGSDATAGAATAARRWRLPPPLPIITSTTPRNGGGDVDGSSSDRGGTRWKWPPRQSQSTRGLRSAPHPPAPPPPSPVHVKTSPEGVLRVTLMMREHGLRRVRNVPALLSACRAAGSIAITQRNVGNGSASTGDAATMANGAAASVSLPIRCTLLRTPLGETDSRLGDLDLGPSSSSAALVERLLLRASDGGGDSSESAVCGGGSAAHTRVCRDSLRLAAAAHILAHDTDVLVAPTDPQLAFLGFLSPGSLVIELRPTSVGPGADVRARTLVRSSGVLKWFLLRLGGPYNHRGFMEAHRVGAWARYGEDHDLTVPWDALSDAIASAVGTSFRDWQEADAVSGQHVALVSTAQ